MRKTPKTPAFQFYPAEFLADENVQLMTHEQRGIYITLICHCWIEGSIPSDPETIARLCHGNASALPEILKCFKSGKDQPDRLFHPRLEKEREKQKKYSEKQSERAQTRWERAKRGYATALPAQYQKSDPVQCSSSSSLSSIHDHAASDDASNKSIKKGSRLPTDWAPSDELMGWARQARPDLDLSQKIPAFRDYWVGVPGQRGVKLDWDATFRNFIREAKAPQGQPGSNYGKRSVTVTKAQENLAHLKSGRILVSTVGLGVFGPGDITLNSSETRVILPDGKDTAIEFFELYNENKHGPLVFAEEG